MKTENENKKNTSLHVKYVPKDWTELNLKEFFGKYGEIINVTIKKSEENLINPKYKSDKKEKIMKYNFAYIEFKNNKDAFSAFKQAPYYKINDDEYNEKLDKLVNAMVTLTKEKDKQNYCYATYLIDTNHSEKILSGEEDVKKYFDDYKEISTKFQEAYRPSDNWENHLRCILSESKEDINKHIKETSKNSNLYVKNLPKDYTDQDLRKLFESYGSIKSAKIGNKPENIKSTLFGYISFFNEEDANKAINKLNKHPLTIGRRKIYVNYFQNKEERKEYLKNPKGMKFNNRIEDLGQAIYDEDLNDENDTYWRNIHEERKNTHGGKWKKVFIWILLPLILGLICFGYLNYFSK